MMVSKKDTMLHIRISSTDLEKVRDHAEKLGVSNSEFCLSAIRAAIGEELPDETMNNVLARLAALEKVVFQQVA